jgi:hypothetical protein
MAVVRSRLSALESDAKKYHEAASKNIAKKIST